MARTFNGTSDSIDNAIGNLSGFGFGTILAIVKRNSTNWGAICVLHNSAGTARSGLEIADNATGNTLSWQIPSGLFVSSTLTVLNSDGWVLIGAQKATGSVSPRWHKYAYGTNTWTHDNGAGTTAADNTTPGAGGIARLGKWETTDFLAGDIAVVGVWKRALSDAEVENLAFSLVDWYAAAPDALWVLDQAATAQTLLDITGGGANQSAISGTTVSTNSVPVFGYGFFPPVAAVQSAPSASNDGSITRVSHPGKSPSNRGRFQQTKAGFTNLSVTVAATEALATGTAFDATIAIAQPNALGTPNSRIHPGKSPFRFGQFRQTIAGLTQFPAVSGVAAPAMATGTAFDATVIVAPNAAQSSGTGTANDASAGIATNAVDADGFGTAYDAAGSVAQPWLIGAAQNDIHPGRGPSNRGRFRESLAGPTQFPAVSGVAAPAMATGTALDAAIAITANATQGSGTGTAFDAVPSVSAAPAAGSGTGTASNASASIAGNAGAATGTGTTGSAASIAANAAAALATGTAFDAVIVTLTNAGQGTLPTAAHPGRGPVNRGRFRQSLAGITDSSVFSAQTGLATGTAFDATVNVQPAPAAATGSGAANDASTAHLAGAVAALATGSATAPAVALGIVSAAALATAAANVAMISLGAAPVSATGTGTAFNAATGFNAFVAAQPALARALPNGLWTGRPYTSNTGRPHTTTTIRPGTGNTGRPHTTTTARPNTGTTIDPG